VKRLHALPVRWRLALTSAVLTFVILALFAVVIGAFTARQVYSNFDDDLSIAAADLQQELRVRPDYNGRFFIEPTGNLEAVAAGDAAVRVIGRSGAVLAQTKDSPDLPPPSDGVEDAGSWHVVSRPLLATSVGGPVAWVQYAKREDSVSATVAQVNAFLAFGVLAGTGLALLAGLAVARRAIDPIARLTGAAKEVARTRDPAIELPKGPAEDEVTDLARTLEEMLAALGAARAETEAALSRQRQFVADASHELRTPLTSVLANLELLEARLAGEDAEIAESALRSSRRMRRLVGDLLLLARADAGREAPRGPVDLADVVRDAAAEAAPVAASHELDVDVRRGLVVDGVRDDLHRLTLNLIENAVAHTPPGTPVHVSSRRENGAVRLDVADEGPGVPADVRERIFDRFVRGGGDGSRGSGLGLAIVSAVARSHGGSVALDQAEGVAGARFVVRLPAVEVAPPEAQRDEPVVAASAGTRADGD